MSKLLCKCGEILHDGLIPNDIEFHVWSDRQMMDVYVQMEEAGFVKRDYALIPPLNVWLCPVCKRLYVFERGQSEWKYIYALEESM